MESSLDHLSRLLLRSLPLVSLLALAGLASPAAVAAQAPAPVRDTVDVVVKALMEERQIPGAAVAILEEGRLVKARGYGLADVEHTVPVTAETLFQSGSLGKQFTAAAVLALAEEGRVDLDAPVTRYLEEAPAAWEAITLRHLLTHTSGVGAYEPRVDFRKDYTEAELVQEIAGAEPAFAPGTEWSYSNSGYVLLGIVVSRVTGAHWGEYLTRRIFEPAGMETAQVISEATIVPNRASGYEMRDGELMNQEWVSPTFLSTGDGALYFSILDVVRWDQALRTGQVLTEESRRAMWTPAVLSDGFRVGYGFGWEIVGAPAVPHVGHGGAWQGFKTYLVRYEEPEVTVAVLVNAAQANPARFAYGIAEAYRPELAYRPERFVLEEAELRRYAGKFRLFDDTMVEIRAEEGGLVLEGLGPRPRRFEATGPDAFVDETGAQALTFVRKDGGAWEVWMGRPGSPAMRLRRDGR